MRRTQGGGLTLITAPFEEAWIERAPNLAPESSIIWRPSPASGPVPDDLWRQVEILYTSFAAPLPDPGRVPQLRWVQLYSAGVDSVAEHPLFASGVAFTTTSGIHAICIGEYVLAMLLAWFHRLPTVFEWQRRAAWPDRLERAASFGQDEVHGKTIGIVGYGSIGGRLPGWRQRLA